MEGERLARLLEWTSWKGCKNTRHAGALEAWPSFLERRGAFTSLLTGVVPVVLFSCLSCLSFILLFFLPSCLPFPPSLLLSFPPPSAVTTQLYPHHLRHEWKSSGPNRTIDKFNEAHVAAKKQLYSPLVALLSVGLLFLRV